MIHKENVHMKNLTFLHIMNIVNYYFPTNENNNQSSLYVYFADQRTDIILYEMYEKLIQDCNFTKIVRVPYFLMS